MDYFCRFRYLARGFQVSSSNVCCCFVYLAFRSALKALDAEHRNFTSRITDLMSSMKAESTDVADKVCSSH